MKKLLVVVFSLILSIGSVGAQNHELSIDDPSVDEVLYYKDFVIIEQDDLLLQKTDSINLLQLQINSLIDLLDTYHKSQLKSAKDKDNNDNLFYIIIYLFSCLTMFVFGYLYRNKKPKGAK